MNGNFMTKAELIASLPWGKTTVNEMIKQRIFKPLRNPLAKKSQMHFWKPTVEKALAAMSESGAEVAK